MELKNCVECGRSFASKQGESLCKRCMEKNELEEFKGIYLTNKRQSRLHFAQNIRTSYWLCPSEEILNNGRRTRRIDVSVGSFFGIEG